MITFDFSVATICGNGTNEWMLGPGRFELTGITYVTVGTNGDVSVSGVSDGSVVAVDSVGAILVSSGPDLTGAVLFGVSTAVVVLGFWMLVKRIARAFLVPGNVSREV